MISPYHHYHIMKTNKKVNQEKSTMVDNNRNTKRAKRRSNDK